MKFRHAVAVSATVAALACLPLLGTNGAMLSPMAGSVTVNGQAITAGSAVMAGDLVATSAQGSARMVLPGSSVIAASKTNFRLISANHATEVKLFHGMVRVSGNLPVALRTRTVVPQSSAARFEVTALNGTVYVHAITGNVAIKAGDKSYTVAAGTAAEFQDQAAAPAAASAGSTGAAMAVPLAIGIAAAAAVITGVVVHEATKCSNCITSPAA